MSAVRRTTLVGTGNSEEREADIGRARERGRFGGKALAPRRPRRGHAHRLTASPGLVETSDLASDVAILEQPTSP